MSVRKPSQVEPDEAQKFVNRVASTVAEKWQPLAKQYGLNREQIQRMEPAFSLAKTRLELAKECERGPVSLAEEINRSKSDLQSLEESES